MDKAYLEQLDKAELARVDEVLNEATKHERLNTRSLFKSEIVSETVAKGGEAYLHGFNKNFLPTVTLFNERTLVGICPACECVKQPNLLKPYLERNLVIPILRSPYSAYPKDFAEVILRYPHLSSIEFNSFRAFVLEQKETNRLCLHCANESLKRCVSLIDDLDFAQIPTEFIPQRWRLKTSQIFKTSQKMQIFLKTLVRSIIFLNIIPFLHPDYLLMNEVENSLKDKNLKKIDQIASLSGCVETFRSSQALSAVPQVSMKYLDTIEVLIRENPQLKIDYDITDVKNSVVNGLSLSYDPSLPIETYLDLVTPRKKKIQSMVSELVKTAKPSSQAFLSNLQRELGKINEEIYYLKSSKRAKLLNFVTNFAVGNKSIIAGCVIGTAIGAGFGLIGCGIGATTIGTLTKIAEKHVKVSIPAGTQEITRSLEPSYEKLLSYYLSKDVKVVQVWRMQKAFHGK